MNETAWLANRQTMEILRAELAEVRAAWGAALPPVAALDRVLRDLAALASAGLADAFAWAVIADRPAGEAPPYLLDSARYSLALPPPATPLVPVRPARPTARHGVFLLSYRPTERFLALPAPERERWLAGSAGRWQAAETPAATLVRPFRPARVWPLADGRCIVKEVSGVGGR